MPSIVTLPSKYRPLNIVCLEKQMIEGYRRQRREEVSGKTLFIGERENEDRSVQHTPNW